MRQISLLVPFVFFLINVSAQNINRRNTNKTIPYRGNYQRITSGAYSDASFEIRNGTLWAWGSNGDGLLGDGTRINRLNPVQIGVSNNWFSISTSKSHTLGLKTDGTLWAWGYNGAGGLGDGTDIDQTVPIRIGTDSNWVSMASGFLFSLGLKADGTLWAWGYNDVGRLGNGNTTNSFIPIQIGVENNWTAISVGLNHSLALKANGTLWAWGDNSYGQLGDGTTNNSMIPIQIGNSNNWTSISAGVAHSTALKADGTLWTWGDNSTYELGDGTNIKSLYPIQITNANNWVAISSGGSHNLAIKSDGTLWSWGYNLSGQVGDGTAISKTVPTQIGVSNNWVSVSGGSVHSLAVQADGSIWSWGYNADGSLGDGTIINKSNPSQIGLSRSELLNVVCGLSHSLALKSDGTLWAWGLNDYGQLGNGSLNSSNTPIQIGTDNNWIGVSIGSQSSFAIKSNGTLWAWGRNNIGQLGDGTNTDRTLPVQIGASNNWVYIYSSAGASSFGIKSNGTLWAWGDNTNGQLGNGTQIAQNAPMQIGSASSWVKVISGNGHSLANKADGTLWAWGDNSFGQLGDGTNTNRYSPNQIGSSTNWLGISAVGSSHSFAIKPNGTLWAWGNNANYQLGDGSNLNRNSPTQIGLISSWIGVSTGNIHAFAQRVNGTLWAWGNNGLGQLGDGTNTNKINPTQIGIANNWLFVSAGNNYSIGLKSNRQQFCVTGDNVSGQLGDGTNQNKNSYSCYTKISIPPPVISGFLPATGSIGTLIKITGVSLSSTSTVGIGSINALIISKTDTNILAMLMPNSISGIVWLKIGTDTIKSLNIFAVSATPYPSIQQGNKLIVNGNTGPAMQGYSVSISADGNTAIVGANNDSGGIGAAWVFTRNNGIWGQQGNKLLGTGIVGEGQFGNAVAISADGNTAIVGANADSMNRGAAFIFKRIGANWIQQGPKLVGSGSIGSLVQMGFSVAISADGNTAIIGGIYDNNEIGAAWVFTRNNGVWSQQGNKLIGTGATGIVNQGYSVAISADGNTALLSSITDNGEVGATWVFVRNAGVWTQQGNKLVGTGVNGIWASQGYSLSLSADGNIAAIGAVSDNGGLGATWVFSRTGSSWTQMGSKLIGSGSVGLSHQGSSVALSADGNTLLVGGYGDKLNQGSVWVFTRNASSWQQQGTKIDFIGRSGDTSYLGSSLSISADASTAIIGGYADSSFMGASWIIVSPNPPINNNLIAGSQSVCFGTKPSIFSGSQPTGGNGIYSYTWIKSTLNDNNGFIPINSSDTKDYSAAAITTKTWFRRCVISGTSVDTSAAILVSIDTFINNNIIISNAQTICKGSLAKLINASNPTGGNRTNYSYSWLRSTISADSAFTNIDSSNSKNFLPGMISQNTWFKRRVVSGACAADTSSSIKISIDLPISNNSIISAPQIVPEGDVPNVIMATIPSGGNGYNYAYNWLSSNMNDFSGFVQIDSSNTINFAPPKLYQNTWYRRIVKSGVCSTDTSAAIKITIIYKTPLITSFNPISAKPGDTVTIYGSNFNPFWGNNIVYFGATKASVLIASDSLLQVKVPIGASYQSIVVTNTISHYSAFSVRKFIPVFACHGVIDSNSFTQNRTLKLPSSTISITNGDLDGDGNTDLISANMNDSNISIFRAIDSLGYTTYENRIDLPISGLSIAVELGDLDGDGKLDMIVVNPNTSKLIVFRNTSSIGNISFASKQEFSTGLNPLAISLGDLDLDGMIDIVTANNTDNTISVLKNNSSFANINFLPKLDFNVGNGPRSIAIGDLDTDGKFDLAIANSSTNQVSVLHNASSPSNIAFDTTFEILTGDHPYDVAIGDLNLDGKPEVFSSNYLSNSLTVYTNNSIKGLISLSQKTDYSLGISPRKIGLTDINGDGKMDISICNVNSNYFSVLANLSNLSNVLLSNRIDYASSKGLLTIQSADIDRDGRPELIFGRSGFDDILIVKNKVSGKKPQPKISVNSDLQCLQGNQFQVSDSTNFSNGTYQKLWRFGKNKTDTSTSKDILLSFDTTGVYQVTLILTSDQACIDSASNNLVVRNPGTWMGIHSTNWDDPLNWSCPMLPDSSMDVNILNGVNYSPVITNTQSIMNLNILPNASLKLNVNSSQLNIYGDINNDGVFENSKGKVVFRGNNNQRINNTSFNKIELNKDSLLFINSSFTINDSLILIDGKLVLGNNKLILNKPRLITSNNKAYLLTNGTGTIQANNIDSFLYTIPLGGESYSPIQIANFGTIDNFSFRLIDSVNTKYINDKPSGLRVSSGIVNKTWIIHEAIPGASNAKILFQWNGSDEQNSFDKNNAYVARYDEINTTWLKDKITSVIGSNPYQLSQSNIDLFGPFVVSSASIIGIEEELKEGRVLVYPNPSDKILNIDCISSENQVLEMYNPAGSLVSGPFIFNKNFQIDVSDMPKGLYLVRVVSEANSSVHKVLVE